MTKASELFDDIRRSITMGPSQGLDYEAHAAAPKGWTVEVQAGGYVFTGPRSPEWETLVWKMIRFLAYKSFVTVRRTGEGESMEYELVSCMDRGEGFVATFRGRPGGV